jgi:hypothetical protein
MPKVRNTSGPKQGVDRSGRTQVVTRDYAGKWVAWSEDGRRIVAVGETFAACEAEAVRAGFPANRIAIDRVPSSRFRQTGSGL